MNRSAEKLLAKFGAASRARMARANAKDAPSQPLFHYTTEQSLYSIIKSETFWFTSIYYMDDDAELSFGFGVAHALLSTAMQSADVLTQKFLKPLVDDYKFDKIKERFEFYSASFGQKDDAQQWRDYAAGGTGVALGLSPGFFALLKKEPTPEETTFLGGVSYGEETAKVRHAGVIDSAMWTVKHAYERGFLLKVEDELEFLLQMAAELYVEILWNSVTSKADKWSHQHETRLLAVNDVKNPKLKIKNKDKRPRVELPQPLLKTNITEIMLGPKADGAAKDRLLEFLAANQLEHVPVTVSTATIPENDESTAAQGAANSV